MVTLPFPRTLDYSENRRRKCGVCSASFGLRFLTATMQPVSVDSLPPTRF